MSRLAEAGTSAADGAGDANRGDRGGIKPDAAESSQEQNGDGRVNRDQTAKTNKSP